MKNVFDMLDLKVGIGATATITSYLTDINALITTLVGCATLIFICYGILERESKRRYWKNKAKEDKKTKYVKRNEEKQNQ